MDWIYMAKKGISDVSFDHGQGYLDSVRGDKRFSKSALSNEVS